LSETTEFMADMMAAPSPRPTKVPDSPLRMMLRRATHDAHQRLHGHDGLDSVMRATISLEAYRALLMRLYGFHAPFETAAGLDVARSRRLADDLAALGIGKQVLACAPVCSTIPVLNTPWRILGARYVIEGSALGGVQLGRRLDRLLDGAADGRRFFLGEAGSGGTWPELLASLAEVPERPAIRAEIVDAANETFAAFETWLAGWWPASHG
jgi:heme oxygenase